MKTTFHSKLKFWIFLEAEHDSATLLSQFAIRSDIPAHFVNQSKIIIEIFIDFKIS